MNFHTIEFIFSVVSLILIDLVFSKPTANDSLIVPESICSKSRPNFKNFSFPFDFHRNFRCSCDAQCAEYDQCCDVGIANRSGGHFSAGKSTCTPVYGADFAIFAVSNCPSDWNRDDFGEQIANKCTHDLLSSSSSFSSPENGSFIDKIIVFSKSSLKFYRNIYCAVCNGDDSSLQAWSPRMMCRRSDGRKEPGQKGPLEKDPSVVLNKILNANLTGNSKNTYTIKLDTISDYDCNMVIDEFTFYNIVHRLGGRPCRDGVQSSCETADRKCPPHAYYVFGRDKNDNPRAFKNYECAVCNSAGNLSVHFTPKIEYRPFSANSNDPTIWFPLLLDFNFISPRKGSWVAGSKVQLCQIPPEDVAKLMANGDCQRKFCAGLYFWDPEKEACSELQYSPSSSSASHASREPLDVDLCLKHLPLIASSQATLENASGSSLSGGGLASAANGSAFSNIALARLCLNDAHLLVPVRFSKFQALLSEISLYISMVCLFVQIIVHLFVSKLQNIPGKNLISLSSALLLSHVCFLISGHLSSHPGSIQCKLFAVFTHYTYLCVFFWMNVMSYDIYRTFCTKYTLDNWSLKRNNRVFLKYSLYSWLTPAVIVSSALLCDLLVADSSYAPLYGLRMCWINKRVALLTFLAFPLAFIIVTNLVFFCFTAFRLNATRKQSKSVVQISDKIRLLLYVKLALLMGFTWIFGFVASLSDCDILWYPFIVMNGLQGAFIFTAFTLKAKVFRLVKQQISESSKEMLIFTPRVTVF